MLVIPDLLWNDDLTIIKQYKYLCCVIVSLTPTLSRRERGLDSEISVEINNANPTTRQFSCNA